MERKIKEKIESKEKGCDFSLHRVSRFLQPSLLLFLYNKQSHGYELIEKLRTIGFTSEAVDIGAIYRTLRKLEKDGFVKSYWEKKNKKRRIYKITKEGKQFLKIWVERIKERQKALKNFLKIYQEVINDKKNN